MLIKTSRFGTIEVDDNEVKIFTFPEGILGFPSIKRYIILENPGGGPFEWLQAVDEPALAFVICNPLIFKPDYKIVVSKAELEKIQLEKIEDASVRVIISIPQNVEEMTANLQGPLIFNTHKLLARQLVLPEEQGYTTKYPIIENMRKLMKKEA